MDETIVFRIKFLGLLLCELLLKQLLLDDQYVLCLSLIHIFTWGNVSEITADRKYVIIKPSGVDYDSMKASDMVVVDLDGNIVEGNLRCV